MAKGFQVWAQKCLGLSPRIMNSSLASHLKIMAHKAFIKKKKWVLKSKSVEIKKLCRTSINRVSIKL